MPLMPDDAPVSEVVSATMLILNLRASVSMVANSTPSCGTLSSAERSH